MLRAIKSAENLSLLMAEDAKVGSIGVDGDCEDETVKRSLLLSKNLKRARSYLTPDAKQIFTQLRQVFIKAFILRHFDLECHIQIKTDLSGYAIGGIWSQLTLDNLGQWHPVAYYFQKIILVKT